MKSELLRSAIESELKAADSLTANGDYHSAFYHLERAHILGQSSTVVHTKVHWRMLKLGIKMRLLSECWGQMLRIVGASTKTPFGIYPTGNSGGADIWFFKKLAVPGDLQEILDRSKETSNGSNDSR